MKRDRIKYSNVPGAPSGEFRLNGLQTNADRIRAMSDEELAIFLAKVDAALYRANLDVIAYRGEKVNENLDWLKQEAEAGK